eukprot:363888-Chlamydomonas_euryale.AAC.7
MKTVDATSNLICLGMEAGGPETWEVVPWLQQKRVPRSLGVQGSHAHSPTCREGVLVDPSQFEDLSCIKQYSKPIPQRINDDVVFVDGACHAWYVETMPSSPFYT